MSNIPILGQNTPQPDRFDREFGGAHNRAELAQGDIHDSEIAALDEVLKFMSAKYQMRAFNLTEFEKEVKDRCYDLGFVVEVAWHPFLKNGVPTDGLAPSVTVVGRATKTVFDHDQKVHEITHNFLGIPGEGGVIKSDGGVREGSHKH